MGSTNVKKVICVSLVSGVLLFVGAFAGYKVLKKQEIWPFEPKVAAVKDENIYNGLSKYFFEQNTGIFDSKAEKAMLSAERLVQKQENAGLSENELELLRSALTSSKVNFTNVKKFGFIYALATWLSNNEKMILNIRHLKPSETKIEDAQRLFRITKELACHLYVQKHNGNISLEEYNDELYKDEVFMKNTENLDSFSNDIVKKARKEYILLKARVFTFKESPIIKVFADFEEYINGEEFERIIRNDAGNQNNHNFIENPKVSKVHTVDKPERLSYDKPQVETIGRTSDHSSHSVHTEEPEKTKQGNDRVLNEERNIITNKEIEENKNEMEKCKINIETTKSYISALESLQAKYIDFKLLQPKDQKYQEMKASVQDAIKTAVSTFIQMMKSDTKFFLEFKADLFPEEMSIESRVMTDEIQLRLTKMSITTLKEELKEDNLISSIKEANTRLEEFQNLLSNSL